MEKRYKPFLFALMPVFLVLVAIFLVRSSQVIASPEGVGEKKNEIALSVNSVINREVKMNSSTEYPIETPGTPQASKTYRPTSTPWPSRTPTPTPPYFYRATNTIAGVTPPTETPLPEKTRNSLATITAFYTTQTARFSTEQPTEAPTETLAPTFTKTVTPDGTEDSLGKEQEADPGEVEFTPTAIHVSVQTDKTDRYQEKANSRNWFFYGLLLVMIGLGLFLYTRKSDAKPTSKL